MKKQLRYCVFTGVAVLVTAILAPAQRPAAPRTQPNRAPMLPARASGTNSSWAHQIWKHLERAHTDLETASADAQSHRGKALSAVEQAGSELGKGVNDPKVVPTSANWSHEGSTDQSLGTKGALIEANYHLDQAAAESAKITGNLGGHLPNIQRLIKQAQSEIAAERAEIQKTK